jgi:hypothetical protein
MTHPLLHITAAQFALDLASSRDLVDAAHAALDDGTYTYSLGELATLRPLTMVDARPLFVNALVELGISPPAPADAVLALLAEHIRPIAEQVVSPLWGMQEKVRELYSDLVWGGHHLEEARTRSLFRDVEDMLDYLAVYEYENAIPGEVLDDAFERRRVLVVVDFARRWATEYGAGLVSREWLTPTVVGLAHAIAAGNEYGNLVVLGDSLEEAGCTDLAVLKHCRAGSLHTDYCWVTAALVRAAT